METEPNSIRAKEPLSQILGRLEEQSIREEKREITIDNNTLVLIVGLPGSGKSTFAQKYFPLDTIISTDLLRQEITNNPGNQIISAKAFQLAGKIVDSRLQAGKIAVVDAQNLTEDTRAQFYQVAQKNGSRVVAIFLDIDPGESIARDKKRGEKVGASYIKGRRGVYEVAKRSLERSKQVNEVHVVDTDEIDQVSIRLPDEYRRSLEEDRQLESEAEAAEVSIRFFETGLHGNERSETKKRLPIKAGAVLMIQGESVDKKNFIDNNFLPHQVIDVTVLAKRLALNVNDEAVFDALSLILKSRIYHNLT